MGRIKKVATERHTATASPFISDFVQQTTSAPLSELPARLRSFPQSWPFPRGDLYHWIPLLDRFDHVLELFTHEYGLNKGPQQVAFACRLLKNGDAEEGMPYPATGATDEDIHAAEFSSEGDKELVESIVHFSRVLLEHCGNRSLYASSGHLNDLLNTTSLDLLRLVLRLSLRLAQRYQVARYKNNHPHAQQVLAANHYNFNIDRLHKIAQPFPKQTQMMVGGPAPVTPGKGKEKSLQSASYNPCDLVALVKEPKSVTTKGDVASVHLTYYDQPVQNSRPSTAQQPSEASPATPTPIRRTSTLGPSRDRPLMGERSATTGDVSATPVKSRELDATASSAPKSFQLSSSKVLETPVWDLVREAVPEVPEDSRYELLNKIRVAKALSTPQDMSQKIVEVRLLAISNLAYALGESKFQERVGIPDSEEPKRFHLALQLCDLLQPPTHDQASLSVETETAVLLTIEALSKSRHKASEVSDALQISQNHGVLYYQLRKVIATFTADEYDDKTLEMQEIELREASFDLTNALLQSNTQARHGERMVGAGIMGILIEALNLHTPRAERFHEKVLQFFDSFIHGISTAFQTLAGVKGLETLADLTSFEVTSALKNAKDGNGLPKEYKSKVVDYEIPFYQQATLRQLFKFVAHMFEHNAGTHDRLLRNLIDTPQILGALRDVIENAKVFGSNVWGGAVNILSSFIHNEPTSFQVVSEAGLVKSLLQNIVPWELKDPEEGDKLEDMPINLEYKDGQLQYPTPSGILPVGETMCDIPTAFGAICLNENGMKQFQSSKALLKFMDIFVSPPHVRALEEEGQTASNIGQAFDELSRHHPQLKQQITWTVVAMVKRVGEVCRYLAEHDGVGAKLWEKSSSGITLAGGRDALKSPLDRSSSSDENNSDPVSSDDIEEGAKDGATGVPFVSACFKFLEGFFHNTSMCSLFCEQGGAVYLLDLATSSSNPYDLVAFPVFTKIAQVVKSMCDAKPHLVLPSLIARTRTAINGLKPLIDSAKFDGAFASFIDLSELRPSSLPPGSDGTTVVKSLAMLHILTHVMGRSLAPPQQYHGRNTHSNQMFTAVNFTDMYIELVDNLSRLHAACVWEGLALQKTMPEEWKSKTEPKPYMMRRTDVNGLVETTGEVRTDTQTNGADVNGSSAPPADNVEETFAIKNARTVRYLLSQTTMGIESFFHNLSAALVPKRSAEMTNKQHAAVVADHIAKALIWELEYKKFDSADDTSESNFVSSAISFCSRTLLRTSHNMENWGTKEAMTLVLNKFYLAGGFNKLNECLQRFGNILAKQEQKGDALDLCARDALSSILTFYSYIVRSKTTSEALQSSAISVRDHKQADFFIPGQFVVEMRDAILPAVSNLWHSPALESIGDNHVKSIIQILQIILKSEGEDRALKRSDNASRRVRSIRSEIRFKPGSDAIRSLGSSGFEESWAREALYRCNNNEANAQEYCQLHRVCDRAPSFPMPATEPSATEPATQSLERQTSVEMSDATPEPVEASAATQAEAEELIEPSSEDPDIMSDDEVRIPTGMPADIQREDLEAMMSGTARLRTVMGMTGGSGSGTPAKDTHELFTTVDDLDEKRALLRDDLIDRCLEVLSAQPTISFELAELIQATVAKSGETANPRADIGSTLVSSLLSLQGEGDSPESAAKIAAYAHLVALIIQDRDFFDSTLDELKENFDDLVSWIQLEQDKKAEDAPWIEMILLIIERVLAEDEQPVDIEWHAPKSDDPLKALPEPSVPEPVVSSELRSTLLDAILDLLLKIGKSTSLALSVCRVLAILTRRRDMAARMSDKHSMSRLFMMIRQLAGPVDEKLQRSFMIVVRHLMEDEQILRQIMQTEIKGAFEGHRSSRPMDTTTYSRNLFYLVLRDPKLFVSVTKDMVEISRYDGHPHRAQSLSLKKPPPEEPKPTTDEVKENGEESTVQKSVEEGAGDVPKTAEIKAPTVESTDGVIQFLLRELATYKDVEDKQPVPAKDDQSNTTNGASGDVDMADASSTNATTVQPDTNKSEKPVFKPEEHVHYIYRCFIMQCLAELLASYTRTKVEFINFSRKPETQPATPSKPRSGTLNYLLNSLIPVGTLEHREDIAHRKKLATSHWATVVLVSLCAKTMERQTPRGIRTIRNLETEEEESDLTFVRKFVLEHALRAFKEAAASTEPLDQRYSRLLNLAELFNRMLSKVTDRPNGASTDSVSTHDVGKLMYEKNFIGALTSAIAEVDLNFPNAKRAIKYILGPLKLLTDLGVTLSQTTDMSSSAVGTTDEEEISSATSVSDEEDDDREQTPDLYRNSTLGMFEARGNRDEESGSGSEDEEDDEDMYDDGYDDDGMDYEEGPIHDHDDVVSDEDEEGMGEIEGVDGDVGIDVDVIMQGGDEDESHSGDSSEDEEDDDEEGVDDLEEFMDHMEEITGDDENASIGGRDEDPEWEDDEDAIFDGADGSPHGGPLGHIAQVIGADNPSDPVAPDGVVHIDMGEMGNGDDEYFEDEMPPEEDDEDDEEPEYDHDVVYEPELEGLLRDMRSILNNLRTFNVGAEEDDDDDDDDDDDEPEGRGAGGWSVPPPPAIIRGHHHHHHHRHGLHEMFGMIGGETFRPHGFRSHRPTAEPRGTDDGTNPLLRRNGADPSANRDAGLDMPPPRLGRRSLFQRHGDSFIQDLVATMGPNGPHTINVNIEPHLGAGGLGGHMPPMFAIQGRHGGQALIDIDASRPWRDQVGLPRWPDILPPHRGHEARTSPNSEEAQAVDFRPVPTTSRWQEEARILFGGKHLEKATRIINSLLRALVPAAMEAKRIHDKAEAERKAAEEKAKEEQRKKVEAEKAEKAEREKKEREEREAKEAEEARIREDAERETAASGASEQVPSDETSMEGVEQSQPARPTESEEQGAAETEEPARAPITTSIRGREVDISSLGIDQEYLDALPEEMREEVIMTQFAEQRSHAAQSGEQPTEISREFLEALPPEIQRELLRQEANDRRRRDHEETRRRAEQEGNAQPAQPEEMNNADFMAMLDPNLRQAILMDADENVLASLPEDYQAEARTLVGERRIPRPDQIGRIARPGALHAGDVHLIGRPGDRIPQAAREAARQRRPVAQMLDKAGIATLLRLMFVSIHQKAKGNLHSILSDVCKNTQNRAEVISILLSILADGTVDVSAVERSFASLSLRAKQLSAPKTPTPLKRTSTGTFIAPGAELSPLNIVQQCLGTLNALTIDNPRVPSFFLTEHETITSQKTKSTKKGKGRELKAAKYPLNSLLALLDRKVITENTGVMETLASLLSRVTHPLTMLLKKAKDSDAQKTDAETDPAQHEASGSTGGDVQMQEAATADAASTDADATNAAGPSANATETTDTEAKDPDAQENGSAKTENKKKHRELVPPEVPEDNIRLVVNIITARECPGKTFSDTLDVIKNLSSIPGAKEVFGRELAAQARELSQAVLVDLNELAKQINAAQNGTDLQGMALANFSSAGAMQTKLLRVLLALDHLFDPKSPTAQPSGSEQSATEPKLKEDILAGFYESSTFDQLWENLSQCLTAIRERGNLVNVATILLPAIESLMVVCRNSALKDKSVDPILPVVSVSTPPPEARLDSLFFKFTEDHRKVLNELIRNNPKLMNGNLAVLAKNSKVLEFDNKRNYFNRQLHTRPDARTSHPSLQLSVRRDQVFLDSFKSLYYKSGNEIKFGKLNIRFHGEEGIDAGGVSREWFAAMARQMFNPDYALFVPVASDRTTFHPNPLSAVNGEHLLFFKFIGRIIGKALYEGRVLDCYFSRAVYRRILGKSVSLKDMESLDLDYYKSLVWILENDITDVTFETFSVDVDRFGVVETVDLVPDGRNISVTEDNKQEYVRLVVEHRLIKSVEEQLENFLSGFHDIIPPELISIFNEQELELLISGLPDIDVDDWKNNTEYHNYQATSPQIQWFWRAIRSFDKEEKAKLLQFVTGTSKVPLNGFKELEGMNGFAKFNIHRDYSSKEKLPSSHTCFNQLDLPEYDSYEHLRQQLYTAITAGSEYFGFA